MKAIATKMMQQARRLPSYLASLVAALNAQQQQMNALVAQVWSQDTMAMAAIGAGTALRPYQTSDFSLGCHESASPIRFGGNWNRSTRIRGGFPM